MQIHFIYFTLGMGRNLGILPLGVWEEGKQRIRLMATLEIGESDHDYVSPYKAFVLLKEISDGLLRNLPVRPFTFQTRHLKGARVSPAHIIGISLSASLEGREQGPRELSHGQVCLYVFMEQREGDMGQSVWHRGRLCRGLSGYEERERYQAVVRGEGVRRDPNLFSPTSWSCRDSLPSCHPVRKLTSSLLSVFSTASASDTVNQEVNAQWLALDLPSTRLSTFHSLFREAGRKMN